jgi:hypothetical protein
MCTVTYVPLRSSLQGFQNLEGFVLTSNRDEKVARLAAEPPVIHNVKGKNLIYPCDPTGHGSWIALEENGTTVCLLNGGFLPHVANPAYKHSRGLVVLDYFSFRNTAHFHSNYAFEGIEPFTLVIVQANEVYEIRWDGETAYKKQLESDVPHIWSSVTLYTPEIIKKREQWFSKWVAKNPDYSIANSQSIIDFHRFTGDGDAENDILMNRHGFLKTVSITSVRVEKKSSKMIYFDLLNQGDSQMDFSKEYFVD